MTPLVLSGVAVTVVGLGAVLFGERTGLSWLRFVGKPAASAGFLLVALGAGALGSGYGGWILAGLVLSFVGDVLLLFRDTRRFLAGLVSFLLAHVGYAVAFAALGVAGAWAVGTAVLGLGVVVVVLRWLLPHVSGRMRRPVLAYVAVITTMLALAVGTRGAGHTPLIVSGATLFYLSDLFVARERFVTPGYVNRLVGLPLYYAGQVLLALSVGA